MKKLIFTFLLFTLAFAQFEIASDVHIDGDIILEGNAADANEVTITVPLVTADRTVTLPDADVDLTLVPTTLTDGGVLLGSAGNAITPMAVLTDGQMIVGDGTTDPVAESGATLRTSIGLGSGDSPTFTGVTATGNIDALTYTGNGAALTGITGATGGIANTGSTTIGADTDSDDVGVIAFQTRTINRLIVENDGAVILVLELIYHSQRSMQTEK